MLLEWPPSGVMRPGSRDSITPIPSLRWPTLTLEGEVLRVSVSIHHPSISPVEEEGEPETWILQGASLNNAMRQVGLKERLQPGVSISARVWLPRNPLFLNDVQTVLLTRPDDARKSSRIVGGGHIKFSNGDVLAFGGGPTF